MEARGLFYFYLKVWLGDLGQSSYVMKERKKLVEHEITVQASME